jgi:predicted Rossmann fold flavoprotein
MSQLSRAEQHAEVDVLIIGAGAAGLFAAIWAGRECQALGLGNARIVAVDGARKPGAKILVAGGGRCNVTHHAVDESAYAGSSRHAIKKVLRSFTVEDTVAFFADLCVELKREETGKLFPTTDDAHTVLDALFAAVKAAGAQVLHPWRAGELTVQADGRFLVHHAPRADDSSLQALPPEAFRARHVILATGGMALPRSGSDGFGYTLAKHLGHTTTPRIFPALVPIVLHDAHFLRTLSGLTFEAKLWVQQTTGKHIPSSTFTGSTLCTHFGLSGPAPLDVSRYYFDAAQQEPGAQLMINFTPSFTPQTLDDLALSRRRISPGRLLTEAPCNLPDRLARALCQLANIDPSAPAEHLTKPQRKALIESVTATKLPVAGHRGFTYAEVTAGGVPLSELRLETMESRITPNLHLCGEICDVDGRIGGFNFQWAWASGYLAGQAAARALATAPHS